MAREDIVNTEFVDVDVDVAFDEQAAIPMIIAAINIMLR